MAKFIDIEDVCINLNHLMAFLPEEGNSNKTRLHLCYGESVLIDTAYEDVKRLIEEKSK